MNGTGESDLYDPALLWRLVDQARRLRKDTAAPPGLRDAAYQIENDMLRFVLEMTKMRPGFVDRFERNVPPRSP